MPNDRGDEVETGGPGDEFVIDRATLLRLAGILRTCAPDAELRLERSPSARAILVQRPRAANSLSTAETETLAVAKEIYAGRRRREQRLAGDLFGEPAWDILLDLFIAERVGRLTQISSACVAAAVPATTAQRWLRELEDRGLVRREGDGRDGRRVYVRLTEAAMAKLERLLAEIGPTRA